MKNNFAKPYQYIGDELETFSKAKNWKRYWISKIRSHIKGKVLEVGAGMGSNTSYILNSNKDIATYCGIEPDTKLFSTAIEKYNDPRISFENVTADKHKKSEEYDTLLYIDVLEHIENDAEELYNAYRLLKNNGTLIILVPAHNFLYSNFDKEIGHFRRYNKKSLTTLINPIQFNIHELYYLDSIGMMMSFLNRSIMKQSNPSKNQILFWDTCIIPISRCVDKITSYQLGKSLIAVLIKK